MVKPRATQVIPWRPKARILVLALMGLFAPNRFARYLAADDHLRSVERNQPLRESTAGRREQALQELTQVTIKRLRLLRRQLLTSLAWLGSSIVGGVVVRSFCQPSATSIRFVAIGSVFAFAWATLGRLGWAGQSIKGDTAPERLDLRLFWCIYWIGMFLTTIALT